MFKLFRKKKLQYLKRKCFHYSRKVPPSCSCCSNWSIFLLAMLFHSSSSATCGASSRLGLVSPSQITIIDFHDFRPDSQAIARQQSSSEHALHLMPSVINGGDIGPCHVHCSVQWWGQPDGLFGDDEYLSRLECARLTDLLVNLREMIWRTTFMSSLCASLQVDEEETAHEPDRPV